MWSIVTSKLTYRQTNKIMAYLTFHKWLVSVWNIHNGIWMVQTKTSHLGKVSYAIILLGWRYLNVWFLAVGPGGLDCYDCYYSDTNGIVDSDVTSDRNTCYYNPSNIVSCAADEPVLQIGQTYRCYTSAFDRRNANGDIRKLTILAEISWWRING